MNLADITSKCYIMALIIRDDGERILLGDGYYEFTEGLQHFQPNTFVNDVVELQGSDGQLLAGQVRRSALQSFDGYIGDTTTNATNVELYRRQFLAFFRKRHFYKVVYIFPDGTAIQRRRGYIVDAPAVQELWQKFPEYHIGLNFEDPNYYEYAEDSAGDEVYANTQRIALMDYVAGGLVWDSRGAVSYSVTWLDYEFATTADGYVEITNPTDRTAPADLTQLFGNATQTTYSGKNLFNGSDINRVYPASSVNASFANDALTITATGTVGAQYAAYIVSGLDSTKSYTISLKAKKVVKGTDGSPVIRVAVYGSTDGSSWTILFGIGETNPVQGTEYSFSRTFSGYSYYRLYIYNNTNTPVTVGEQTQYYDIQLEEGTTATAYEPYVGGTASPNPDYSQAVNVVTGEQTVRVTGKNLAIFDDDTSTVSGVTVNINDGTIVLNGTSTAIITQIYSTDYVTLKAGQAYTLSANNPQAMSGAYVRFRKTDGNILSEASIQFTAANAKITFTPTEDVIGSVQVRLGSGLTFSNFTIQPQLEAGSSASSFEPYQSQSYTIDLGSTELANIGDYLDYIWLDEGTWKIHKAVGKVVLDGTTQNWYYTNGVLYTDGIVDYSRTGNIPLSDYFIGQVNASGAGATLNERMAFASGVIAQNRLYIRYDSMGWTTANAFATWLSTHNTTVYYALATPTDTEITDTALLAQLNAIGNLFPGLNHVTLTPTAGAQGEIQLKYPTNYIELGGGYQWDASDDASSNIATNYGIDSTGILWTVVGPATNPTLTNETTNQTLTWQGTVPAGQTLNIDTTAQTAELAGANVYAQVQGDWVQLAPGANRLVYTATDTGDSTEPSTISWNGVAG